MSSYFKLVEIGHSLSQTAKAMKPGEAVSIDISRIQYARNIASLCNTMFGDKSFYVKAMPVAGTAILGRMKKN